ncbi:response regulator [Thalassospira sp.]|uniref:response regulator n=1 Tax=Thalassospira sp. TaxID=1912094 RepID=UPI000C5471B5|nr:response regulator [Thalassospira sp.]MBC08360.1 response regulator [Thalassospira sp.]|tara:strand:- start:1870 stop:3117 length:1248 start_codon:yes stop_codon:yes gene_type:complete
MPNNASIIFVDDDLNVLRGLRRRMLSKRPKWTLRFYESAEQALVGLEEQPADVVISDMRMPSMDGAEFLRIVAKRWPQTSRILLSGYADETAILNGAAATHHFLAKPCTDNDIIHAAERGLIMNRYLRDPLLVDLLSQVPTDLMWPATFRRLHTILQFSGPSSHAELNDFANDHPALTALAHELAQREELVPANSTPDFIKLLKVLGIETIKALCVLWCELGQPHRFDGEQIGVKLHRPLVLGQMAANIARLRSLAPDAVDQVRASALLCHIGGIIMAHVLPEKHAASRHRADTDNCDIISAEISELGFAHPAVSACLCTCWGFPHQIIENIAFHHRPESAPTAISQSLLIVYAAQHFARKAGVDGAIRAKKYDLASGYITKCGAASDWPVWEQSCFDGHVPLEPVRRQGMMQTA